MVVLYTLRQTRSNFADGCKHVFLDFGGNLGVHTRFLHQPELYPKALDVQAFFDAAFGSNRDDVCVFGFEPNPQHIERLKRIEQCYPRVKYFCPAAIGVEDGNLYFIRKDDDNEISWGGQIGTAEEVEALLPGKITPITTHNVTRFMLMLFDRHYDRSHGLGKIHAKIDIEGSEILLLPTMENAGLLCADYGFVSMTIEIHPGRFAMYKSQNHTLLERFANQGEFNTYYGSYAPKSNCKIPTKIVYFDSESYAFDEENPLETTCPNKV
jgi:hypothetical protein